MLIALHKNATTTPATRLALQQASGTDRELAQQYGIGVDTVRKWRHRSTVQDASHTAHRLQTALNTAQEELVIYLRTQLLLPLDDLLAVVREFIEPSMSRSALDRLLRRRGHSRLPAPSKPGSEHKPFKAYEPGYVHIDVKYLPKMQDEDKRRYVFVAIDRATRWVFIAIKQYKTAASAKAFLAAVRKAAPFRIRTILTDNGKEFTDRLFGGRSRPPTGEHEFDQLCQVLGIEHRLTKPKTPQTNGMVERFNGRLSQVLRSHHFNSAEDLEKTLHRFAWLYNHHLPQKALGHLAPVQALKAWRMKAPDLFVKNVRNHPGPDSYGGFDSCWSAWGLLVRRFWLVIWRCWRWLWIRFPEPVVDRQRPDFFCFVKRNRGKKRRRLQRACPSELAALLRRSDRTTAGNQSFHVQRARRLRAHGWGAGMVAERTVLWI